MRTRTIQILSLATLALCCSALLAASDAVNLTTRQRLDRFGKELSETWEKYPTEAQKAVRQQTLLDLNSVFMREVARSEAPKDKKIMQVFTLYLNSLEKTTELFKVEKMKLERANYVKACAQTFKRELQFAVDYANPERTTQNCYDLLTEMLEEIRDRFVTDKDKDIRSDAFSAVNSAFSELMNKSKIPDVDHSAAMDKNIKEAKTRFPITTEAMKAKNGPAYTLCENAAKAIKQRAVTMQR
jgi:hypothetical protein